ncbi:MAG: ankyrin repeat domain-containing protein [Sumerlaeia bacterium]
MPDEAIALLREGIAAGDIGMLRAAFAAGADPNARLNGLHDTALLIATASGNLLVMEYLIDRGADPDLMTWNAGAPIHQATRRNQVDAVETLLRLGAAVDLRDMNNMTALQYAAMRRSYDCARLLLGAGADPNACHAFTMPPLLLAIERSDFDMAALLLGEGRADPNVRSRRSHTALHMAVSRGDEALGLIDLLIAKGADVNARSSTWQGFEDITPLHVAAFHKNLGAMRVLIAGGASPTARDANGHQPLYWCREKVSANEPVRRLLQEAIARIGMA